MTLLRQALFTVARRLPALTLITAVVLPTAGCEFGSEAAFRSGAELKTCEDAIPVCNTTAGCVMREEDSYIEGEFPGYRSFIVPTEGEAYIRLLIYWRSQLGPGADTEIRWYEPACVESYRYESQGINIFDETDRDGIFTQEEQVFRAGDHLIEIRSDATGEYLIRPVVLTVDEWEAEQAAQIDPENLDEWRPGFFDGLGDTAGDGSGDEAP
jgi:hypothetical protein